MRLDLNILQSALLRNYHNSTPTTQTELLKNDHHLFDTITDASSTKQEKRSLLKRLFDAAQNQASYNFLDIPEELLPTAAISNPRKRPAEEELTSKENKRPHHEVENKSAMEWVKFFNPPKQSTSRRKPRSTHRAALATSNDAPEALIAPAFKI